MAYKIIVGTKKGNSLMIPKSFKTRYQAKIAISNAKKSLKYKNFTKYLIVKI